MPVQSVPPSIVAVLSRRVPGALPDFVSRVSAGLAGIPGGVVTSWWRSPSANDRARAARTAAGLQVYSSSPYSQHLVGLGVDVWYRDRRSYAAAKAGLQKRGLIVVDEGDHLHAQYFPRGILELLGVYRAIGLA